MSMVVSAAIMRSADEWGDNLFMPEGNVLIGGDCVTTDDAGQTGHVLRTIGLRLWGTVDLPFDPWQKNSSTSGSSDFAGLDLGGHALDGRGYDGQS